MTKRVNELNIYTHQGISLNEPNLSSFMCEPTDDASS